jgi:steroid delta-isomerase
LLDTIPRVSNAEKIAQTVRSYVELAGKGDTDGVVGLFAEDATVEDPVGGDVHRGIDAIRAFVRSNMDGRQLEVHLLSLNVAGGEAAFHFQVTIGGQRLDVIDTMTFDDDAKISSMKSYWGPANFSQA